MQRRLNNDFGNIFGMRNLVEKTSCDSTLLEIISSILFRATED